MLLRTTIITILLCRMLFAAPNQHDIILADFEGDDFGDWTYTGDCFGSGPAHGPLGDQKNVAGFEGKGFLSTYHGGDTAEGIMTSPEFVINRDYINFLIGGGDTGETSIELLIDGGIAFSDTGRDEETLRWRNWDLRQHRGKIARIRIVDTKSGNWGHLNIDSIILSQRRKGAKLAPITRKMNINARYLNFPVRNGARKRVLRIYLDGSSYREFKIELADKKTDVWMFFDVSELKGRQIELRLLDSDMGEPAGFAEIYNNERIAQHKTLYKERLRPQFHFTTRRGWINDENGLVYYKGTYHLFYQHNPFGVEWGNMHWGHAISDDLVRWKEQKIALYQQSIRDMAFSGTAVIDKNNDSGFKTGPEDPMLLFFTSTGRGECVSYSNDAGRTFTEYSGNPVIVHEGRDPKVVWYEPDKKWVLVVYDVRDGVRGFAFYDSKDLKNWRLTSWIGGFFEFPDLYELPIDGNKANKKWIIHGPDGRYLVGNFDGTVFAPDSNQKVPMDHGKNFYAAYTYSNIPPEDGRTIQLVWMRGGKYPEMPFNQQLTFPCELSLKSTPAGPRLCRKPIAELDSLVDTQHNWTDLEIQPGDQPLEGITGDLFDIRAQIQLGKAEKVGFRIRGIDVIYNVPEKKLYCLGDQGPLIPVDGRIELQILVDRTSLEIFSGDGLFSLSTCMLPDDSNRMIELLCAAGQAKLKTLSIRKLKSIWN